MKIAAIIPAYNEEKTVAKVVNTVVLMPEIDEVIVINDGSRDRTAERAQEAGAHVIDMEKNMGKGAAVKRGIDSSDAEVFILLDADLLGLKREHVMSMLAPVMNQAVDMTIGLFRSGRLLTDLAQILAPNLSGQRAFRRDLVTSISGIDMTRFGVEVAMTCYAQDNGMRVLKVLLPHVSHVMKEEKLGIIGGFISRLKMYRDIVQYRLHRRTDRGAWKK